MIGLASVVLGPEATQAPAAYDPGKTTTEHVVGQLIAEGNVWVFLLCFVSAAVVAPVSEEFLFRVLLQGWLEALEHRWRRRMPTLRRLIPRGVGPIVLASLVFARLHFRVGAPQLSADFLIFLLAGNAVASVLAMAFAVEWMRWRVGPRPPTWAGRRGIQRVTSSLVWRDSWPLPFPSMPCSVRSFPCFLRTLLPIRSRCSSLRLLWERSTTGRIASCR